MKLNQKIWCGPRKVKARLDTIIVPFRKCTGLRQFPAGSQYWTVSGQCTGMDGEPNAESEISQLLEAGFLLPCQFHGVDNNPEIIAANAKAYPDAHWHAGDFYRVLHAESSKPDFRPGLVNADLTIMPDRAAGAIVSLMSLLSYCDGPVMLLANMVLQHRQFSATIDGFLKRLNEEPSLRAILDSASWTMPSEYYWYAGTGEERSRTAMGSVIFWKERS
jgi:hypothetical protein